jgi:hypothetical protein
MTGIELGPTKYYLRHGGEKSWQLFLKFFQFFLFEAGFELGSAVHERVCVDV